MKKLALLTVLLLVAAVKANADDIITKTNGEQIKAKVLEVGDNTVKFMRLDNPNGPTYFLNFSEIQSIAYENGFVENYSEPAPEPQHYYAERHDISYRDIANIYNPRAYVEQFDDPYSPAGAGVASFFIPGLGQCIDGEWGRGIGIFAGHLGFSLLEATEVSLMFYSAADGSYYFRDNGLPSTSSNALFGASLCAALITSAAHFAYTIWNICDAVNVAKVKNMYFQDLRMTPNIAFTPSVGNGLQPTVGLGVSLSF